MTPPRRRIFLICGYAGAGKDTVGRHLVATRACVRYAFADGVREVATLFGDRYNVHRNDDDDYDYNVPYKEALTQCGGYEAVKRDPLFKDGVRDYLVKIGHGLTCLEHLLVTANSASRTRLVVCVKINARIIQ